MNSETKQKLARTGDLGLEACAIRLRAARIATGLTQMDVAGALGYDRSTNISNMEKGKNQPNRDVMAWFWLEHRIDFNFLMAGLYSQLPSDVQDRLFPALATATTEWEQKEGSNSHRTGKQRALPQT